MSHITQQAHIDMAMAHGRKAEAAPHPSATYMYPFGNTEEELRLENLGAAERGHPTDKPFDHTTGKGYVKHKKGIYYDALFIKKNKLEMLIHETSSGFSPPCVARIKRFGRKARASGDRTHYPTRRSRRQLSYGMSSSTPNALALLLSRVRRKAS